MARVHHVLAPAPRRYVIGSKIMGAILWCWVFWRLKHDPEEVFVSEWEALISATAIIDSIVCIMLILNTSKNSQFKHRNVYL